MKTSAKLTLHLLPNAHIDPVWLWDWQEGLNEGLTTVSTILDLMDEYPDLTFLRGEAVIYRHIQKEAPALFRRVRARIEEGRWDVVGGTWIQPDSNLSSTETLCRQFETSLRYFEKELGVRPRVSWQADSFGHTVGWPNILHSFGMDGFAFTRPQREQFPLKAPLFWWNSNYTEKLLCYRQHCPWYCCERYNLPQILDNTLQGALQQPYRAVGLFMGLGNHGGGPTRRHLAEVEKWKSQHPEVEVKFSTLHGLFAALREELKAQPSPEVPVVRGDLGYCQRGCYSSVQKFKSLYRQAEAGLASGEATQAFLLAGHRAPVENLDEAWEAVLFNSFHDILPGTSIERAMEEQMVWTGMAVHHAHRARFAAMNQLAARVDTRVPPPLAEDQPTPVPLLIWNPLPRTFRGPVEIEACLDYRFFGDYENRPNELPFSLRDEKGRFLPFQEIATEHTAMPTVPWRKRVVAHLEIPPLGWRVVQLGLLKKKLLPKFGKGSCTAQGGKNKAIAHPQWQIATTGKGSVSVKRGGVDFLSARQGIRLLVVEDPWGSWGGMKEERESFCHDRVREEWKIAESAILEKGPERSRLWTRWQGRHSWLDLTFDLCRDLPWVTIQGRMLWNERSARLQLVIPSTGPALCDVPANVSVREERGQVPVGRWFHRRNEKGARIGIASDVLSDVDFLATETRLTLARASRYANDFIIGATENRWEPAVDCGELKFRLCLFTDGVDPDHVADYLLYPPTTLPVRPSPGPLAGTGSVGKLSPETVRLLSAKIHGAGGIEVRVQNRGVRPVAPKFQYGRKVHTLGRLEAQEIRTFVLPARK